MTRAVNSFFDCRVGDKAVVVVQPGKDPQDVAVHGGHREAEADGSDGPGGVVPDAGQGPQGVIVGGQLSAVRFADDPGGFLQVADPAVIAQPLPQLVQLFLLAGGQRGDIRQGGEETLVIGQRRRDPGLLEHDLAEPDMVRAGVGAERQHPLVLVEPVQQRRRNVFHEKSPHC